MSAPGRRTAHHLSARTDTPPPPGATFGDVYRTYFPAAAGLARSLTRDAALAEDIAAEGLLRVWRQWDAGAVAQPWGYIRRTVVNETISRARRAARHDAALHRLERAGDSAGPEAVTGDRDLVERLLATLPPQQRRIVELRFLQDLSERETAQRLGVSVGAVKSGASRALAKLRTGGTAKEVALAA